MAGASEMTSRMRQHDWAASPLGLPGNWPQSLRTLVDVTLGSALASAVVCGPDQVLIYNERCAALLGDAHPGAFGQPSALRFPEALSDSGPIHARLLDGEAISVRNRPWVFARQGALVTTYLDAHFTPVCDEGGDVAFVHVVILDAVHAGEPGPEEAGAAQAAPSPRRALSPDVLLVLDHARMRLDYASPALAGLVGPERDGMVADFRRWLDAVYPADRAAVEGHLARAANGEAAVATYRFVLPADGRLVSLRHSSFPLQDTPGAKGRVAGIVQDVTAVKQGEADLAEETERHRRFVEGMPQLAWTSSDEGLWTWASPQWLAFTGLTQEQSHGWGWLDAIHPDDREATMQAWHAARPHGMLDVAYRVRRIADKAWRWHQTRSLPRRRDAGPGEPEGRIVEWFGTSTDIHDLKMLQARQEALIAELEQRAAGLAGVVQTMGGRV